MAYDDNLHSYLTLSSAAWQRSLALTHWNRHPLAGSIEPAGIHLTEVAT